MKRREFLKKLAVAAPVAGTAFGLPQILSKFSSAAAADQVSGPRHADHLFVQIQIEGGADMVQSLDPLLMPAGASEKKLWRGYADGEILSKYDLRLGPAAAELLRHAADIFPVRGIWMDPHDKSHESCRTYMASGIDKGYKVSPILVSELGRTTENGLCGVLLNTTREFFTGGPLVPNTVLSDLRKMSLASDDFRFLLSWLGSINTFEKFFAARESYARSLEVMKKFSASMKSISPDINQPIEDEVVLAHAFAHGISSTAFLNLGGDYIGPGPGLDSHSGYDGHLKKQKWFWDRLAMLFDVFKSTEYLATGDSLFSRTTFLVTNEFSRPPAMNSSQGKDHNCSTNAALIAGRGIRRGVRGGRSIGGSTLLMSSNGDASLAGLPFDFESGVSLTEEQTKQLGEQFSPSVRFIRPEDVILTVASLLGIQKNNYQPLSTSSGRVIDLISPRLT